jgi:hypothetical protein
VGGDNVTGYRTFKYVDKDRIVPFLRKESTRLQSNKKVICSSEIDRLIVMIEDGMFDWQPAE